MRPQRSLSLAVVLLAALGSARIALAGPPLICHPFVTDGAAPQLPWVPSRDWRSPDPAYDVRGLVADTLALLTADAPVIARMENMRRATIYADGHPELAATLLRAVLERTKTPEADPRAAALEWFDAGYLVETYRHLGLIYQHGMLPGKANRVSLVPSDLADLDGYALVQKAAGLAPTAEIDFAAWLMTSEARAVAHRDRAVAGAAPGSLLAQNLAHYDVR